MKQFKNSPWGHVQYQTVIAPNIVSVETAGHGGLKVLPRLNRCIPDYLRNDNGWYEEDCEWAKVFIGLEQYILSEGDERSINIIKKGDHKETLKNWYPDAFEKVYGKTIQPR